MSFWKIVMDRSIVSIIGAGLFSISCGLSLNRIFSAQLTIPSLAVAFLPTFIFLAIYGLGSVLYYTTENKTSFIEPKEIYDLFPLLIIPCILFGALLLFITGYFVHTVAFLALFFILSLFLIIYAALLKGAAGIIVYLICLPLYLVLHWTLSTQMFSDFYGLVPVSPESIAFWVLLFSFIVHKAIQREKIIFSNGSALFLILIILNMISSCYFSNSPIISLKCTILGIGVPFLFYIVATNLIKTHKDVRSLILTLMTSSILFIGYGFFDIIRMQRTVGIWERVDQIFTNPILFSNVLLLFVPLFICSSMYHKESKYTDYPFYLCILGIPILILLLQVRAAWAGFLVSLMVISVMEKKSRSFLLRSLPIAMGVLLLVNYHTGNIIDQRVGNADSILTGTSFVWRVAAWGKALEAFKTNIMFGIGPGMFSGFDRRFDLLAFKTELAYAHNTFLSFFAEGGVFAGSILVFIFYRFIRKSYLIYRRSTDDYSKLLALGFFSGLVGYTVSIQFGNPFVKHASDYLNFYYGHTMYLFLSFAMITVLERMKCHEKL